MRRHGFKKIKIFTFCLNLIEEKETNAKIERLTEPLLTLVTIGVINSPKIQFQKILL